MRISVKARVFASLRKHKASLLVVSLSAILMSCASAPLNTATPDNRYGVPITERTLAQRLLDQGIERTALVNIYALDPHLKSNSRLSVNSFYSDVLLTGEVPNQQVYDAINEIVSSMPDVKRINNYIEIRRNKGLSYTVHDRYITSKLNAKILADPYIGYSQVKVVTDDGVVYVLGRLTPSQQEHLRDMMSSTVGIKDFVILTSTIDGEILPAQSVPQPYKPSFPQVNSYPPQVYSPQTSQAQVSQGYPDSSQTYPNNSSYPATQQPSGVRYPVTSQTSSSPYIELYKNQVAGW
ncbi:BON domain-containing protein [Psychrobacter sp. I-STPA6b]|uniref:BON domain-containing protein n=1 Tax=Psychrobacter sp. I-STPA6b TaxID=2585718 RepID=UPI001D0C4D98|nr:BON domain-containing protein [Psychrobacter sp. I-STPA6b]